MPLNTLRARPQSLRDYNEVLVFVVGGLGKCLYCVNFVILIDGSQTAKQQFELAFRVRVIMKIAVYEILHYQYYNDPI